MSLKPRIDQASYDQLPDILKAEYKPEGEGFKLDVTPDSGWELTDTGGLLNSLTAARRERDEAKAAAREAQRATEGIDIDQLRNDSTRLQELLASGDPSEELKARREELERQLAKDYERKANALQESTAAEIRQREERINALSTQLDRTLFETEAMRAIQAVDPDAEPLFLIPELQRRSRVAEREGQRVIEVLDADGQPRMTVKDGQPVSMQLPDVVQELKRDARFGRAFGAAASGSGALAANGPGESTENPFDPTSPAWNLTAQGKIAQSDPARAAKLRAMAPKPQRRSMLPKQASGGEGTALNS